MEYVKLKNLVTLKQGMAINSKSNHLVVNYETSLPLLRIADMPTKNKVIFMDEKTPKSFWANENDIIYTRTGQVGLVFRNQRGVVHNNCFRVIPIDETQLDKGFLYWALKLKSIYNYANSIAAGAAQPDLPHDSFKTIKIPIFDIDIQRKIANILDNYDLAIENNNKRIKILEQMAENIYKEWFVRFRFPGHEKTEFENGLPKGWKQYSINELCYINKYTINKDENIEKITYLDTGSLTENVIYSLENYQIADAPSRARRKVKKNSILFSTVRPILKHYGILKKLLDNLIVSTGFAVIDSKYNIENILFLYLSTDTVINYCQTIAENAVATYPSIKPEDIGRMKITLPTLEKSITLNKEFEPIFLLRQKLIDQNSNLTKQRDLLLPRLMSGKLAC